MNAAKKKAPERRKQAVDASRSTLFNVDPSKLVIVGLDTKDGPEHPLWQRRIKLPVDVALAKNINKRGVIQNITVVKDGDRLLVAAGRQRVRSARLANEWREEEGLAPITVPVTVKKASDEVVADIMVAENELRRSNSTAERMEELERYISVGRTTADAAIAFGVEPQTIDNWLSVIAAGPAVKKAFYSGSLPLTSAVKISKLARDQQAKAVEEATKDGKATVATAERAVRSAKDPKAAPAIVPPGKRLLKKLVQSGALETARHELLRWVLGEIDALAVGGLATALRAVEGDKHQEAAQ